MLDFGTERFIVVFCCSCVVQLSGNSSPPPPPPGEMDSTLLGIHNGPYQRL